MMKKLSLIFVLALAIVAGVAQTQFTATYTFGSGGNVQSFAYNGTQYNGITMGNIQKVGVTTASSDGNFRATGWPTGFTDTSKYIGFTITANPGYKFTVNTIEFGIGRDADGTRYTEWTGSNNYSTILNSYTLAAGLGNMMGTITNPDEDRGWTGNVLSLGTAYQNIETSCGFRMYMSGAETASGTAGLQGPITITGSFTPSIEVSISQLPHISVQQSAGPSSPQSFTVSAVGLIPTYSLMIKAPDSYELAHAQIGPYYSGSGTFSVISDGNGYVAPTPVYVRLRQGLYAGDYNGNVKVGYEIPDPDVVELVAVTGTVTPAPEYYAAFEKAYEVLGDYNATPTIVPLGVNEQGGELVGSLNWSMTQARIGSDTGFVINGKKSARLRGCANSGMTMAQDKPSGGGLVSFCYRRYSSDAQVAWKVEYSIDQGDTWEQVGSSFTAPASNEIQNFDGTINDSRPVRIRIVRADPTQNPHQSTMQLNIDCIRVTHYYDFPAGEARTVGNDQITITGGNVNYIHGATLSDIPNSGFTPSFHRRLTLLGSGPWTFNVTNANANYVAYKQGNSWQVFELTSANNYTANFTVTAAKNAEIELLTGTGTNPTLPVTLSHFSATLTAQNYVQLTWVSQTETNLLGYNIYRSSDNNLSSAAKISELIQGTNTSSAQTYVFFDMELAQEGTYYYWLQNVDMDGTVGFHGPVSVAYSTSGEGGSPGLTLFTALGNAYPNPFNPSTCIPYRLEGAGKVKIDIYDQKGRKIRSFRRGHAAAGHYGLLWDGRDGSGKTLPSGVYLLRMTCGTYVGSKKVVLQK